MAGCSAIKANGERCKGVAVRSSEWCAAHHPGYAESRRRGQTKGGHSRGKGDLKEVKGWLLELARRVETGELEAKSGTAVSQILNTFLRGVEVERKLLETQELQERLGYLEELLQAGDTGGGRRGA